MGSECDSVRFEALGARQTFDSVVFQRSLSTGAENVSISALVGMSLASFCPLD